MTIVAEDRRIKKLSPLTINRIAAGEVVERPASVVKELVENSLDAGATEIVVRIELGGKNLISITDNGCGIAERDLASAVERHTTSKLIDDDLLNIKYFGFRGEALPSIGSISRMTIRSRTKAQDIGAIIRVIGGDVQETEPTSHAIGTTVEIKDLFFATPARLKFLRAEKTEMQQIVEIVEKISLAHPEVAFKLISDDKTALNFEVKKDSDDALFSRVRQVMGKEFADNSIRINSARDGMILRGYISLPTYSRGTSADQHLYVNNRPVKDKVLSTAVRIAYQDFISRDRNPALTLFAEIPCELVDVNAHPAKTEVRFRDIVAVRNMMIGALKSSLLNDGQKVSTTVAFDTLQAMKIEPLMEQPRLSHPVPSASRPTTTNYYTPPISSKKPSEMQETIIEFNHPPSARTFTEEITNPRYEAYKLGSAVCQLYETYIVSQTSDSVVIVDQHAAHERLIYEKLKAQMEGGLLEKQRLLIPEILELNHDVMEKLLKNKEDLSKLGLTIEYCTSKSIIVTEIPHILGRCNVKNLVEDLADDMREFEENISFKELINHILGTYACHHSIRAGRKMNIEEMNSLLREMEVTEHSGQCNHGRPTYIELELKAIEKLFGRR